MISIYKPGVVGAGGAIVVGVSVVGASELPFGVVLSVVVGSSVVTVKMNLIYKWFSLIFLTTYLTVKQKRV